MYELVTPFCGTFTWMYRRVRSASGFDSSKYVESQPRSRSSPSNATSRGIVGEPLIRRLRYDGVNPDILPSVSHEAAVPG